MNKEDIINTLIVMGIMIILIVLMCMINNEKNNNGVICDEQRCYKDYKEVYGPEYKPDVKVATDEDGTVYVIVNGE